MNASMYAKVLGIMNIPNFSFNGISAKERMKNKNEHAKPIPVIDNDLS